MSIAISEPLVWHGAGRSVPVELRADRRSRLSLRADASRGVLRVSLHPRTPSSQLWAFLDVNAGWIEARVARWPVARPFAPGASVPVEGIEHIVDWEPGRPRKVEVADGVLRVGGPADGLGNRIERFLRTRALALVEPETRELAARLGKPVARVAVRDTASRWGSCSTSGGINYSWRLIFAPPEVRRSVVAHEVAHLAHMNHGREFWALAKDLYGGDMLAARRWLKANGASLHWIGRNPDLSSRA